MANDFSNVEQQVQEIFKQTCGTWQNCNEETVLDFLAQCREHSIDPQFSFNWLEEYKDQIAHWHDFSEEAQAWVNEHTSSGSPYTM